MALEPMQKWAVLRERLVAASKRVLQAERHLEDVECECEAFVKMLVDGKEERHDGVILDRGRWETGFRNVATLTVGVNAPYEIDEVVERVRQLTAKPRVPRDAVAQAFGWKDWAHVVHDSQRDGYTEAGGRGKLAGVIGQAAGEARALVEHVERYMPLEPVPTGSETKP